MKYIKPEINIKRFSTESIVTVSGETTALPPELQEFQSTQNAKVAQVSLDDILAFNN